MFGLSYSGLFQSTSISICHAVVKNKIVKNMEFMFLFKFFFFFTSVILTNYKNFKIFNRNTFFTLIPMLITFECVSFDILNSLLECSNQRVIILYTLCQYFYPVFSAKDNRDLRNMHYQLYCSQYN